MLNVWLIQIGELLPIETNIRPMRTSLIANELVQRGHNVLWWASSFDHFKKDWVLDDGETVEINDNFKIFALKGLGYNKNVSIRRYIDHRVIAKKFKRAVCQFNKPDIIVASTPPHDLAYEAVKYAKDNNVPVIVDIRDLWPDTFTNTSPKNVKWLLSHLLHKDFKLIRSALSNATSLVAVNKQSLEWGLDYANRRRCENDKVFYLGCLRKAPYHAIDNKMKELLNELEGKFVATFIGTFGHYNNPGSILDCATEFTNENVYFVLAGTGELLEDIRKTASCMQNVSLPGWLNGNEIATVLEHSDVGLCPAIKDKLDAFHNKVFLYLSAGLPILSAFEGELRELIEGENIGLSYQAENANALKECIITLSQKPSLYKELSQNATRVFSEHFDAQIIYKEYADHIEYMANTRT